ncbi:MAG: hypothetical protein J0H30_01000, partial [Alphaproteobacteria bacterium]|nr:hypothetical protein [Alphaproteobacteria bacterium]
MTGTLIAKAKRVAFQGEPGAYANLAAREALAHVEPVPRPTFEDAVEAVNAVQKRHLFTLMTRHYGGGE